MDPTDFTDLDQDLECACQDLDQVYRGLDVVENLEGLANKVEAMPSYDEGTDSIVMAAMEGFLSLSRIGVPQRVIADLQSYKPTGLRESSLESLRSYAGDIWKRIIEALKKAAEWVFGFIDRVRSRRKNILVVIDELKELDEKWRKSPGDNPVKIQCTPEMRFFISPSTIGASQGLWSKVHRDITKAEFAMKQWFTRDMPLVDFFVNTLSKKPPELKSFPVAYSTENIAGHVIVTASPKFPTNSKDRKARVEYLRNLVSMKLEEKPAFTKDIDTTVKRADLGQLANTFYVFMSFLEALEQKVQEALDLAKKYVAQAERIEETDVNKMNDRDFRLYEQMLRSQFFLGGPAVKLLAECSRVLSSGSTSLLKELSKVKLG